MSAQIPNPGEFAGMNLSNTKTVNYISLCLRDKGGKVVTSNHILITCWAFAAWRYKAEVEFKNKHFKSEIVALKNAALCLAISKGG